MKIQLARMCAYRIQIEQLPNTLPPALDNLAHTLPRYTTYTIYRTYLHTLYICTYMYVHETMRLFSEKLGKNVLFSFWGLRVFGWHGVVCVLLSFSKYLKI